MKTKTTLTFTLILMVGSLNTAWAQVPAGYTQPAYAAYPSAVAPASYCDDCGDVSGSCGCEQGHSGLLSGLLGGAGGGLGAGGLGGSGGLASSGFWGDAEYLLWWGKERYVPALATTSPDATPENQAGRLGLATTTILFGDEFIGEDDPASGFRVSGGKWLDGHRTVGVGGRFFWISGDEDFSTTSDLNGSPILARPFFNINTDAQDALLVAFPGVSHGSININAENEVYGFDIFVRRLLLSGYCNRFDLIGGYHNSRIEDTVDIKNRLISDDATRLPIGSVIDTRDVFEVRNQFDGGFVGLMATAEDGKLSWKMLAKVAFGNMNQRIRVSGMTQSSVPGPGGITASTSNRGLLALPSISDRWSRMSSRWFRNQRDVGYNVTNNIQLTIGYSFIYWTEVALAGNSIDTAINTTQLAGPLAGPAMPVSQLESDGFWYTGLSFGGSVRY